MISLERPLIPFAGDPTLTAFATYIFKHKGFDSVSTDNVQDISELVDERDPDLIALDLAIAQDSLGEACEVIAHNSRVRRIPLIVISPENCTVELPKAESSGFISHMRRPFTPDELVERAESVLRTGNRDTDKRLSYRDLMIDLREHRVYRDGAIIELGPVGFKLLKRFIAEPRKVFTREELLTTLSRAKSDVTLRSIDVHISRLRKALGKSSDTNYLRTVRSAGYALDIR